MIKKISSALNKYRFEIKRNQHPLGWKELFFLLKDFPKWFNLIDKNPLEVKLPWINYRGIAFLDKHVKKDMNVFEFGSGGSTKYWIGKGCKVYSVEHDREWYELVLKSFSQNESDKHKLYLKEPEPMGEGEYDISDPDCYASFGKQIYKNYATKIDEFEDGFFDIISIDGRARPSCVKHSVSKLKKGGYLVLDNSDREYYTSNIKIKNSLKPFIKVFESFGPGTYTMMFWQTTIWQKNNH